MNRQQPQTFSPVEYRKEVSKALVSGDNIGRWVSDLLGRMNGR
jgi:hypothetical protein